MSIDPGGLSRRGFLGLAAATAGCSGVVGRSRSSVSVLAAGSLQPALRDLQSRTDATVEAEAMGSVAAARLVASGDRDPDILVLADTALLGALGEWHARIATNALSVAYTAGTEGGRRVAGADPWLRPILSGRASLGRTDPDLDPLGYRTLFMTGLAADHYGRPDLRAELLSPDQIYPETALLSQFDTGSVDAAVVYRSMALDRGYPTVDLPAEVDLSDPARADRYAEQRYTLPDGTTVRGGVIEYGATRRADTDRVRTVFETIVSGGLLPDHGFSVPEGYPAYVGDVPDDLR